MRSLRRARAMCAAGGPRACSSQQSVGKNETEDSLVPEPRLGRLVPAVVHQAEICKGAANDGFGPVARGRRGRVGGGDAVVVGAQKRVEGRCVGLETGGVDISADCVGEFVGELRVGRHCRRKSARAASYTNSAPVTTHGNCPCQGSPARITTEADH